MVPFNTQRTQWYASALYPLSEGTGCVRTPPYTRPRRGARRGLPLSPCVSCRMMWAAGAVAAMSSITFPAVSALVSRTADADQQGKLCPNALNPTGRAAQARRGAALGLLSPRGAGHGVARAPRQRSRMLKPKLGGRCQCTRLTSAGETSARPQQQQNVQQA